MEKKMKLTVISVNNVKQVIELNKDLTFDVSKGEQFIFSKNITPLVIPPPTRHPLLYKIWFDYALPYIFKKHKPDLFLSPDGFLSLRSDIKSLPVIHDLNKILHIK